jgi:DNA invertase Pin-like site-specific DNA recombinase
MAKVKGRAVPRRKLKVVNAVVYLRVARNASQAARSIAAQIDACQEHARDHGMNISQTFRDDVDAGEPLENRPALLEAIDSVWGDDILLVASYDRLASGDGLLRAQVEAALLRKGAELVSTVADPQGTAMVKDVPIARLMQMLREYEACILKPQTKISEAAKPAPCLIEGTPPYGYNVDASACEACARNSPGNHWKHAHVLTRNGQQMEVIERILLEKDRGKSLRMIAAGLNDEGVPGPDSNAGGWTASNVALTLKNSREMEAYLRGRR